MCAVAMQSTGVKGIPAPPVSSQEEMAPRYDPSVTESRIYAWWEQSGFFKPNEQSDQPPFIICMPPPNITGGLHMGHAMFVTLEDILTRYHRMKGRPTLWLPGKDHAGIATQLVVAKSLAKEGINYLEMDRQEFVDRVWRWKNAKGDYISEQFRKLGASCDWSRERFTLEDHMSNAVVEAFLRLYDKGLIYRGDYMVNWSPGLMTAVSDIEVEFSEETGKLYYFRYPLKESPDEFIPVATTRPETILGDTAVCVHPEDDRYKHLIGKKLVVPVVGREIFVIADDYVDREFGTGALKITPGHDSNDYELGKRHNLPIINIMNRDATINSNGGPYRGLDRFVAREKLWKQMEADGLALKVESHASRVPRSQRGGEIVEPLVSTQWFVKMDTLARPALDAVREGKIRILPERFEKVFYNWLENIRDWCISRQLWWGHQIPVWNVEEHPGEFIVARDDEDARKQAAKKYGQSVTLIRDQDVLDTWFSSGLWPFAAMGWPDNDAQDLQKYFPGTVMETGYDILFFWVARMIMMSLGLTGKVPFETVYLHGLVRDAQGRKMSKSVGNVIDPVHTLEAYGTDALRYTLVTGSTPGQDIPLSVEKIEANRNFANKLWNAGRYILGNLDAISREEREFLATVAISDFGISINELPLPERYIISKLHILVDAVGTGLESLAFGDAGRQIYEFLWDEFADWYVEASKTRLYGSDAEAARVARATLVYTLDTCLRLLHPFMPFVTEALWHRFPRDKSPEAALITAAWPKGGEIDHDAIKRFERIQALIRSIRNARAEYQVVPAKRIPVTVRADEITAHDVEDAQSVIALLAKVDPERLLVESLRPSEPNNEAAVDAESDECLHLNAAGGLQAVIPMRDMIDYDKERLRLEKQIGRVQKDLDGLRRRLNAPGFAEKAPPHVVSATRTNAGDLDEQLESLTKRLDAVKKMGQSR